jgi:hypothetical protein
MVRRSLKRLEFLLLNGAAQPQGIRHSWVCAVRTVLAYFMEIDSPFMEN